MGWDIGDQSGITLTKNQMEGTTVDMSLNAVKVVNFIQNIIITGDKCSIVKCNPDIPESILGKETSMKGCQCASFWEKRTVVLHMVHINQDSVTRCLCVCLVCVSVCVCVSVRVTKECVRCISSIFVRFFVHVIFQRGKEAVDDSTKTWIAAKKKKVMILMMTLVILGTPMEMLVPMVVMLATMMSQETIPLLVTCIFSWVTECCNDTEVLMQL